MSKHGTCPGDVMPIEVMARREQWSAGVSIYMRKVIVGVSVDIAQPVAFKQISIDEAERATCTDPTMRLSIQSAQQLMDELWQCGLRPTEGTGSAGSLAATERHLSDMQKIAFKLLREECEMAEQVRVRGGRIS